MHYILRVRWLYHTHHKLTRQNKNNGGSSGDTDQRNVSVSPIISLASVCVLAMLCVDTALKSLDVQFPG